MGRVMKAVPLVVLCALIIAVPSVWANWVQDGVAISMAGGNQLSPTITSDGAGGAIVTWYDYRSGNYDIYAQRVNASGAVQWTVDGVALCTATGDQDSPQITSDGAGGAIVTWVDRSNYDIYAQRVNASGAVQWTIDGVALCTAMGYQWSPTITSDGAGGAIVAWYDVRSGGKGDIYAQRVNASGAVQWTTDGITICMAVGYSEYPTITSDGAGGAIVTWPDDRSAINNDIYAQKVNASGAVQWTANGVALCTELGAQVNPQLTSDGAGGAVVTWWDGRSGFWDIYAQRVNALGAVQWTANGVAVCIAVNEQNNPRIISDGAGGAIVAWQDDRVNNYDIYAQRVNASGAVQWTANGIPLCTTTDYQMFPTITSDGAGGAIVTWQDYRSGNYDIYAQRVNGSGDVQWAVDGVALSTAFGDQQHPTITSDGAGGAIVTWDDSRGLSGSDVYAQRVDAAGHTVVATLLQNYAATFSGDRIAITWTLSEIDEGVAFSVERATASDGPFIELPSSAMRKDGLSFTFTDTNWQPNMSYWYRVGYQIGSERKVLFETGPIATPALPLSLYQNSPNPFNPSTTIKYYLPEKCRVELEIYDSSGRRIATLVSGEQEKGRSTAEWNGKDEHGHSVASGIYFYKLAAGKETISRKMVLLR